MQNVLKFSDWMNSRAGSKIEEKTENLPSYTPEEDLKQNYSEWRTDHWDKAEKLLSILKKRHPEAEEEHLKSLADEWVGEKPEEEEVEVQEEPEGEEEEEKKKKKKEEVNEGKMKDIAFIGDEAKTEEEFVLKLKEYLLDSGKEELANDEEFISKMIEDWKSKKEEK